MRVLGDVTRLGAKRYPDRIALVFGDATMSYHQLDAAANRLAAHLAGHGVVAGDRVALLAENCIEYPVAVFAVLKLGAVLVPLNFRYRPDEVAFVVNDATPRCMLFGRGYESLAAQAATGFKAPVRMMELEAAVGNPADAAAPCNAPALNVDPATAAMVMYTSGTTGFPKGVLFSHSAYLASIVAIAMAGDLKESDRMLVSLPLFHNGGLNGLLTPALTLGATVIIGAKGFQPEAVLACVERHRISVTMWVPTMLSMLVSSSVLSRFDVSSLTKIWYGSSPITPTLLQQVRDSFNAGLYQFYGMTEIGMTSVLRPADHERFSNCTGREMFNADMRIVDEALAEVGVGAIGEILSRREPLGMIGYINNERATNEAIVDGWIRTGDLARNEGNGLFTIVDRKKDMLISGAENIYPKEIENVIAEHEAVQEVAVFAIPDVVYGESVCAALVLKPAMTLSEESVVAWCAQRLAGYKKPKRVVFVAELPKNAAGKVMKHVLKAPYWREEERKV